jgi:hypothetical protein
MIWMLRKKVFALLPLFIFVLQADPVWGTGSIFSGLGYGMIETIGSSRSIGMGNPYIALSDSIALNAFNPALLAEIQQTRVSVSAYLSRQRMRDHQAEDIDDWAQFEYFSLALKLRKGLGLGFILAPYSRVEFSYGWDGEIDGASYYQTFQGNGGLSRASLHLGWSLGQWGKVGLGPSIIWGQVEELRGSYFDASGFQDVEFLNVKQWLAFTGTAGLLLRPHNRLTIGATYEPEVPVNLDQIYAYTGEDSTVIVETEYRMAAHYGFGLSYLFSPRWLTALQATYSPWGELTDLPEGPTDYQDAYSLSAGVEWSPGNWDDDWFLKRLQYRFGGRYENGYVESQNSSIESYTASAGISVPFSGGRGRLDFALEYGQRGDLSVNGGQENIIKFHMGLNLGESWFLRTKRSWE